MSSITLDPSQQRAVDLTCKAALGIVTGGPGTGKSTCLATALDRLDLAKKRYELAAPTGKAAKRMNETTGREARTIHRLLEFHPGRGFQRNRENPLDTDVVIIDESSMVDTELAGSLLAAVDVRRTSVILIGDADQLRPVGPGRPFGDLIDSGKVPLVRLEQVHRSLQESWICKSAPLLLAGKTPDLTQRHDFRFVEIDNAADILPAVRDLVVDVIPREIDADAQVLIPQRDKVAGVDAANRMLQSAINPRPSDEPYVERGGQKLCIGDRVIQTRNDYKLGIFNGEIGEVQSIEQGKLVVDFGGREPVPYNFDQVGGLQLAYALTVHKSQGSEFPWVICVVHSTHSHMLTRQLVYTAITRGKQGVILVGDRKGLRHALSSKQLPKCNTSLAERLHARLRVTGVPANDNSVGTEP